MTNRGQSGFTLVELLVSMSILMISSVALAQMMMQNTRINKSQQMTAAVQADARNCMSLITQRIRSAGWDPMNAGIPAFALDATPGDSISEIEVFADLDEDGLTDGTDEQTLIRHTGNQVVWRRTNDTSDPFIVLANNISNDADGNGTVEQMFVPIPSINPSRILVRITAQSPAPDPVTREFIRYTLTSEVTVRKAL